MRKLGVVEGERSWNAMLGNGSRRRRSWRDEQKLRRVHPKVARWAQEEYKSSSMPFFIKVIGTTSDYTHHRVNHGTILRIPAAFAREHSRKMDQVVSLEDSVDGSTWTVAFRVPEEFPVWTHGWPEFAHHYHLQQGQILVFILVAQSRFLFTLFNDHGCQIIHPAGSSPSSKRLAGSTSPNPSAPCPKFYSRRLQLDGATVLQSRDNEEQRDADRFSAENTNMGHQAGALNKVQPGSSRAAAPRKFKAANPAQDNNHHICIHMGIACAVHHRLRDEKPNTGVVKQIPEQCEELPGAGLEPQLHRARPTCVDTGPAEASSQSANSFETLSDSAPVQKLPHLDPLSFDFHSKRRLVTPVERREARNAASRYARILSNSNSMTVLRPSHVYKEFNCMELPRSLLVLSGGAAAVSPESSSLTLIDSTGRSWEMQWTARGRHRLALFPKDWALFAVHHFLEEGDACVFEAADVEALTILVRIFRIVAIPRGLRIHDIYTHYSVELVS